MASGPECPASHWPWHLTCHPRERCWVGWVGLAGTVTIIVEAWAGETPFRNGWPFLGGSLGQTRSFRHPRVGFQSLSLGPHN